VQCCYVPETSEECWPTTPLKHILLTGSSLCCCSWNEDSIINFFSVSWNAGVGGFYIPQFAIGIKILVGIYSLWYRFLSSCILSARHFRNASEEEESTSWRQPHESDSEKEETETDIQWTDSTWSCAPLIHKFTGGERVFWPHTTPWGSPTSSTSQLKVQNSGHWPQNAKQIWCFVCSTKSKPGKDLNVQSAMYCCVDCCFRVLHTKLQFWDYTSKGKADYKILSVIFHYVWVFF